MGLIIFNFLWFFGLSFIFFGCSVRQGTMIFPRNFDYLNMFFTLTYFYLSLVLDVLREKRFSFDIVDFFEMIVHNCQGAWMRIQIVWRVDNRDRNFFTSSNKS